MGIPTLGPGLKNQHPAGRAPYPLPYDLPYRKFLRVHDHTGAVEPGQQGALRGTWLERYLLHQGFETESEGLKSHLGLELGVRLQKRVQRFAPLQVIQQPGHRNPRSREHRRAVPDLPAPQYHLM
jgi:hypothetical protein